MKEFFNELFGYSFHYNQELIKIFSEKSDKTSEKSLKLFSHILNAHQIWNTRIKPNQAEFIVWQIQPLEDFQKINKTNYENSLLILNEFDLNQIIHYKFSNGQASSNSVRDMLFQVINHSTYHRAQIATDFKNSGIEPLRSDFILYKR